MDLKTRLATILASFAIAVIFLAFGAASVAFTDLITHFICG